MKLTTKKNKAKTKADRKADDEGNVEFVDEAFTLNMSKKKDGQDLKVS